MRSIPLLAATTVILLGATACGDGGGDVGPGSDPVAGFTFAACTAGTACTFTDASSDPDGANTITGRKWNFGDGTPEVNDPALTQSHTFATANTYNVTLTVTDNTGRTNAKTNPVIVTAGTANTPPTAAFTGGPCTVGVACAFTDASIDPDGPGEITVWNWTFGDPLNGTSTIQHPTYTYQTAGTFTVTLTVTDNDGAASAPVTAQVVVSPPAATQCTTSGNVVDCVLDMTSRSTVTLTINSVQCQLSGNRITIPPPIGQTAFFNACQRTAGEQYTIATSTGAPMVFEAGSQVRIRFNQGTPGVGDPAVGPPAARIDGTAPTWTISVDDGGNPTGAGEPDFTDVVLGVQANPAP